MIPKPAKRQRRAPAPLKRTTRPRKVRKSTVAALKRKLWILVAKYVRERDGYMCVTCPAPGVHAGHFFTRRIASTWIDPKNIACQCETCNMYMQGNPGNFAEYIVATYGPGELTRLSARAQFKKQWRRPELEMLIEAIKVSPHSFECAYYEGNL